MKILDTEENFWKKTAAGQQVIQAYTSHQFPAPTVGEVVSLDGREVTVVAVGKKFKVGKDNWVYLYPEAPKSRQAVAKVEESDFERSERAVAAAESARELG